MISRGCLVLAGRDDSSKIFHDHSTAIVSYIMLYSPGIPLLYPYMIFLLYPISSLYPIISLLSTILIHIIVFLLLLFIVFP